MRTLQVIFVFILAAHQSYQHHIPSLSPARFEVDSSSNYDESLKPGIYRLALDRSENPSYKLNPETTHANEEIYRNRVYLGEGNHRDELYPGELAQRKTHNLDKEEMHYRGHQVDDKKRSIYVRTEDKKRSVSVKSKAYDEDYDNQLMDKKRSVSVPSAYEDEVLALRQLKNPRIVFEQDRREDVNRRTYYDEPHNYEQHFRKQHEHDDEQEEYSHIKARSLVPSLGTEDLENTLLKKMTEKLIAHQSVPVTLREIHQIVRESQKQIWDQVVKMFPGGEMAQAMLRAQRENLFAGLAFNPFKQNVKGTNVDNGLPGANTIFPVPQPTIPGPLGKLLKPQKPSIDTEAKKGGIFNPLGFIGSRN